MTTQHSLMCDLTTLHHNDEPKMLTSTCLNKFAGVHLAALKILFAGKQCLHLSFIFLPFSSTTSKYSFRGECCKMPTLRKFAISTKLLYNNHVSANHGFTASQHLNDRKL